MTLKKKNEVKPKKKKVKVKRVAAGAAEGALIMTLERAFTEKRETREFPSFGRG